MLGVMSQDTKKTPPKTESPGAYSLKAEPKLAPRKKLERPHKAAASQGAGASLSAKPLAPQGQTGSGGGQKTWYQGDPSQAARTDLGDDLHTATADDYAHNILAEAVELFKAVALHPMGVKTLPPTSWGAVWLLQLGLPIVVGIVAGVLLLSWELALGSLVDALRFAGANLCLAGASYYVLPMWLKMQKNRPALQDLFVFFVFAQVPFLVAWAFRHQLGAGGKLVGLLVAAVFWLKITGNCLELSSQKRVALMQYAFLCVAVVAFLIFM